MRGSTNFMLCAVCALGAMSGAAQAGRRFAPGEDLAAFNLAQKRLSGGGGTMEAFGEEYAALNARDPQLGLLLAVLHPWLTSGEAWERTHAPSANAARGQAAPSRSGAPVTGLTVTRFTVSATSIVFRAEWPLTLDIPCGWLELSGKLDLDDEEWEFLSSVIVEPAQGYADFELQFCEDSVLLDYMGGEFAPRGFFKLAVPVPEEWYPGIWDEEVDDGGGEPPDNFLTLDRIRDNSFCLYGIDPVLGAPTYTNLIHTFDVTPGELYLLTVRCSCREAYNLYHNPPYPYRNSVLSWNITAPDGQTLTGSADTSDIAAAWAEAEQNGESSLPVLQDYILFRAPEPPPGARAAGTEQVAMDLAIWSDERTPDMYASLTGGNGSEYLFIDQYQVRLIQPSMPDVSPGNTDTDRFYKYRTVGAGGCALIGAVRPPAAPQLSVRIRVNNTLDETLLSGIRTAWRLKIVSERPDYRGTLDDREYPGPAGSGAFTPLTNSWVFSVDSLIGGEVIGGRCELDIKIKGRRSEKVVEGTFPFRIRGMNPPDGTAWTYLSTCFAASELPSFGSIARAIAWHESASGNFRYNQFNTSGSYLGLPFKGNNKTHANGSVTTNWGWGICQIDRGPLTNGATRWVTTAEVWDWRTNIASGVKVMEEKRRTHLRFMADIQRFHGSRWVAPPLYYTFTNGIVMTAEEFCTTVLYNGAHETMPRTTSRTADGTVVKIRSPLHFNPDANPKWKFYDNNNKYADLIANTMRKMLSGPSVQE